MNVLLICRDLYASIGGGQSVYRKLIADNPDVNFTYFLSSEPKHAPRPANVRVVRLLASPNIIVHDVSIHRSIIESLREADRYARSVAGESFDIVDVPDFEPAAGNMRMALDANHVRVQALVLALHGTPSQVMRYEWLGKDQVLQEILHQEDLAFAEADGAYGISRQYGQERQKTCPRTVYYLDPMALVDPPPRDETRLSADSGAPVLNFVGRTERRKGPDLFVELARWVSPRICSGFQVIGDPVPVGNTGSNSSQLLLDMAKRRGAPIHILGKKTYDELSQIYRNNSITFVTSRYDSFSLIALESLLHGCPTVISKQAGVCSYLEAEHPQLPFFKLDVDRLPEEIGRLEVYIGNHELERKRIAAFLESHPQDPVKADIRSIYSRILEDARRSDVARGTIAVVRIPLADPAYTSLPIGWWTRLIKRAMRKIVGPRVRADQLRPSYLISLVRKRASRSPLARALVGALSLRWRVAIYRRLPADAGASADPRLDFLESLAWGQVFRGEVWREASRQSLLHGYTQQGVSYGLRILRAAGADLWGTAGHLAAHLAQAGFVWEAEACRAQFGLAGNDVAVYQYLRAAAQRNLAVPSGKAAHIEDRRRGSPAVSVIVSLYRAASKLRRFLAAFQLQTLWKAGGVELILVDSGSPDDERSVVMEFVERHPDANLLYARTDERETIQAAWNRGIQLAKAPYLVFLGADETLYPEALEVLARELDADAGLDWVMGDSLVTSRDANGAFQSDVMLYDRTGATKDHAYLETTYLSWVAGMYRKSIHDRFGYYDQTFGAAGDTEFKGRVLPFIQVRFLPQTLGEFWNYPEERTTASPRAEIEDSRAWYLHRTPGGIRYAFENRPVEDIIQLLHNALGYRKCYAQHVSCDIEYALHLCNYLLNRRPGAVPYVALQADLAQMLADLRGLDFPRQLGPIALVRQILMARWRARRFEARHRKLLRNPNVSYRIFNDNRYEQHHWFWPVG